MNLFLCKTPMQILRAVQLTYCDALFKNSSICVFKTFDQAEQISERISEIGLFHTVQVFENNEFARGKFEYLRAYKAHNAFNEYIKKSNVDSLTIFNSDSFDGFSAYNILKHHVEVRYVEDAPMLYSYIVPSYKKKLLYKFAGLQFPIFSVNKWYFSLPEKMKKINQSPVFTLPPMDRTDKEFVKIVNYIFEYVPDEAIKKADVFIMEESFYNDGLMQENADYVFYEKLRNAFPNLNFLVKLHPRTRENRFKDNFEYLHKSNIPWEVYLLNENFDDKIFISMSCTTMISPKLLFGKEYYCMLIYKVIGEQVKRLDGTAYYNEQWLHMLDELQKLYTEKYKISAPESEEETLCTIRNWIS